ncbi:hypothetical protein Ssi02_53900 [Sinosporangium siamense]|uniref:Uncharacterized protein n=1 Tax=Sinosporangium siamense TaxID=1367973 RepID=A0A919RMI5_9ACTN|nr:hypothetical protein Ssi02_53900 [Sinosporangium siamense]
MIDPEVPERSRKLLQEHPEALHPPGTLLRKPRFGGRTWRDLGMCLLHAPGWALLPAVMGSFHRGGVQVFGFLAQAGVICAGGLAVYTGTSLLSVAPAGAAVAAGVMFGLCGEGEAARLGRTLRDRYVRPEDLGDSEVDLLHRAGSAVAAVLGSEVNRAGLLDDVRNTVTLPAQVWEIAQTLAQVDALRREHEAVPDRRDPRIAVMLHAQGEALALATASVTRRVGALEDYAVQVVAADDALRRWETAQRLSTRSDAYRELLARTVRDELAVTQIEGLTEDARRIEEALLSSVDQARRSGLRLVVPVKEAS